MLQKHFLKYTQGIFKYQEEILKSSIPKEVLKLEIENLKKENLTFSKANTKLV